jgi:ribosomal protein S1
MVTKVKKTDSSKDDKKEKKTLKKTTEKKEGVKSTAKKEKAKIQKDEIKEVKKTAKIKQVPKKIEKKTVKVKPETEETSNKVKAPTENNLDEDLAIQVIRETLHKNTRETKVKSLKTEPQSMDELLEMTGYQLQGLKKSQEILATVTDKAKKTVFFDIGAKTEGILLEKEMDLVEDYIRFLNIGDTVKAIVVSPENEKGQILISLAKAANDWKWNLFEKYLETEEIVEVRGLDINRGGMIARLMNVRGFIPISQFGRQWIGKLEQLYNKVFPVRVIEVDREKNRLIFSEKSVSESEIIKNQQTLIGQVKVGTNYKGQVSGVMAFGIFVRVFLEEDTKEGAFLDGLVHISELSWEKVNDVAKLYRVGDVVDVQIIDVDQSSSKLNLSIKRLSSDPWEEIASRFPVDAKAKGTVTRLAAFGAFVEIEKGIEGLIHVSKIPSDMDIKAGDKVDVYIESLDKKNHRISLGVVLSTKPVGYK